MRIKFLGAAGTVTGSSYLLTGSKGTQLLIDLGMFQGPKELTNLNRQKVELNAHDLAGVLLTHAHLDHCGRLPLLMQLNYRNPIFMTAPTRALAELTLLDTAKIAKEDEREALFTDQEVHMTLGLTKIVNYHETFSLGEWSITYLDAGHILGSASIELVDTHTQEKIVFSGDLGNTPEPISAPTEYPENADYVVMESTYGGRTHSQDDALSILANEINTIESFNSTLLIPAFSLERTQVLLHMLDHLKKENKIKAQTQVYLDSPMGIKATYIYSEFPELYGQELKLHTSQDDPFEFPGLTLINKAKDSSRIQTSKGAKVIIAGSGMMNGGRILNHAQVYLPDPKTRLLIVGYQGEGTIGRQILDGAQSVNIYGKNTPVNAKVRELNSISAHADEPKLITWLTKIKGVKKVVLTHGEDDARQKLQAKIQSRKLGISEIYLPNLHEEVELD